MKPHFHALHSIIDRNIHYNIYHKNPSGYVSPSTSPACAFCRHPTKSTSPAFFWVATRAKSGRDCEAGHLPVGVTLKLQRRLDFFDVVAGAVAADVSHRVVRENLVQQYWRERLTAKPKAHVQARGTVEQCCFSWVDGVQHSSPIS